MVAMPKKSKTKRKRKQEYHSDDDSIDEVESSEVEEENNVSLDKEKEEHKSNWADVMINVLNQEKPKEASTVVLAKVSLEQEQNQEKKNKEERRNKELLKRQWEDMCHKKPNVLEKDYERVLQKVATKGVIQLFNVLKKHQNEMSVKLKEAKTELKKDKVYKKLNEGRFMDMLSGDNNADDSKAKPGNESLWKVLDDDYLLGNKMGDWDEEKDDKKNEDEESVPKKKRKKMKT